MQTILTFATIIAAAGAVFSLLSLADLYVTLRNMSERDRTFFDAVFPMRAIAARRITLFLGCTSWLVARVLTA